MTRTRARLDVEPLEGRVVQTALGVGLAHAAASLAPVARVEPVLRVEPNLVGNRFDLRDALGQQAGVLTIVAENTKTGELTGVLPLVGPVITTRGNVPLTRFGAVEVVHGHIARARDGRELVTLDGFGVTTVPFGAGTQFEQQTSHFEGVYLGPGRGLAANLAGKLDVHDLDFGVGGVHDVTVSGVAINAKLLR